MFQFIYVVFIEILNRFNIRYIIFFIFHYRNNLIFSFKHFKLIIKIQIH